MQSVHCGPGMMSFVEELWAAGLGLDYRTVRLERTTHQWHRVGSQLRDHVGRRLGPLVVGVEQIGSSAVQDLLAKPIVDLAVGLPPEHELPAVVAALEREGWIYRGDAGNEGGHVFVLEERPWHRVAHLHAVEHDGAQWRNYLRFRDLLRRRPEARSRYEAVKLHLAEQHRVDRKAYTDGKTQVIGEILTELHDRLATCAPDHPGGDARCTTL